MATISSAGVGSGLDVRGLVEQLVAAEGDPVRTRLDRKEADLQEGLTSMASFRGALTEFKSSLENLRDSEEFRVIDVISSDTEEEFLSITSDKQASPTEFNIDVLQLAKSHKLTSTSFESDTAAVGSGTLTFQFGEYKNDSDQFVLNSDSTVHTVKIEPENNNLRGISDAINNANIGVKSIVINSGDSARLIFSSLSTGENNNLRITVSDDDNSDNDLNGLSTLAFDALSPIGTGKNVHETQIAQDAKINIDGIEVTHHSNTIADVIRGVTFDVHTVTDNSVNVQLQLNNNKVADFVEGFVTSYNELDTIIDQLTGYDPETKTAGPLSGDPSIRGVAEKLRRNLSNSFENVNEKFISLPTIGIQTDRDGQLTLDRAKLTTAIESDLPEVIRLFSKTGVSKDALIDFVSASDQTVPGSYDIDITQLATKAIFQGQTITVPEILIDKSNNNYVFKIDGVDTSEIALTEKNYSSIDELATELQTRINTDENIQNANVSVNITNNAGKLEIESNRFGSGSRVEIVRVDKQSTLLGLVVAEGIDGVDVSGSFSRVNSVSGANTTFNAIGAGQVLTGTREVEGLKVKVIAGKVGERQNVVFSRGIGEQLDLLINKFIDSDGILSARSKGFNTRLEDITQQREVLTKRLEKLEGRLMKKFTSLDASLSRMRKSSELLSNQLSGLPGPRKISGN